MISKPLVFSSNGEQSITTSKSFVFNNLNNSTVGLQVTLILILGYSLLNFFKISVNKNTPT